MSIDVIEREQAILDAAAAIIIQHGYNKTTMGDVADAVGLSRGLVYLHFRSKDDLLEALIAREMQRYGQLWIDHIEADPAGGTIGSTYRGIAYALNHTPFMAAIVARDEGTFGKYLRKPGNIFESLQTPTLTADFLKTMQAAGVVRADVDTAAMAFVMDALSYGLVRGSVAGTMPPFTDLLETIAEMLDRMLTPAHGGSREAGKAILRQLAADMQTHFARLRE
jgi:AcrR family transcriptional regulator